MRESILITIGAIGGTIASYLGGWDYILRALIILMCVDYVSGLVVAGIFKKSKKSQNGTLNSHTGFKGIIKKCMMIMMVLIAYQIDYVIGWHFVRYAVIIAFLTNELISIMENAALMGVPVPAILQKAIDFLIKKSDDKNAKTSQNQKVR